MKANNNFKTCIVALQLKSNFKKCSTNIFDNNIQSQIAFKDSRNIKKYCKMNYVKKINSSM